MPHNIYRNGRVHVCAEMCPTCVFRPGNPMQLKSGRLKDMVDGARGDDSTIVCHETLDDWDGLGTNNAACRGFFDHFPTQPLQIAERMGLITEVTPNPRRTER